MIRTLRPIVQHRARAFITKHHRHNPSLTGWLFGTSLSIDGEVVAVAAAARPRAPRLQDGTTVEIVRVCTLGHDNACSQLYGSLCRAAKALGYTDAISYTRVDEPGTSLKAAGFKPVADVRPDDGNRPSRPRTPQERVAKTRWHRSL